MTVTTYWPPRDYAEQFLDGRTDGRWSAKASDPKVTVVRLSWSEWGYGRAGRVYGRVHRTPVRWAVWYDRRFLGLFDRRKAAYAEADHAARLAAKNPPPTDACPGSRQPWGSGTGTPICPTCHRGPRALGVIRPRNRSGRWVGLVPTHVRRTS